MKAHHAMSRASLRWTVGSSPGLACCWARHRTGCPTARRSPPPSSAMLCLPGSRSWLSRAAARMLMSRSRGQPEKRIDQEPARKERQDTNTLAAEATEGSGGIGTEEKIPTTLSSAVVSAPELVFHGVEFNKYNATCTHSFDIYHIKEARMWLAFSFLFAGIGISVR